MDILRNCYKVLEGGLADLTMGEVNNSNKITYDLICIEGKMAYIGRVSNSNQAWHVQISVVYHNKKQVGKNA